MCQQCTTEATAFKKRPFKGWFLVQATNDKGEAIPHEHED